MQVDFTRALENLIERGLIAPNDRIAHMSGLMDVHGSTTSLEIDTVEKILKRHN